MSVEATCSHGPYDRGGTEWAMDATRAILTSTSGLTRIYKGIEVLDRCYCDG